MERNTLDTNILLRAILNDVPEKREKVVVLLANPRKRFEVADVAISEAVYVLTRLYGCRREVVVKKLTYFLGLDNIIYNAELFELVFSMWLKRPKLAFNDCYLVMCARVNQAVPLYTFDYKLAVQAVEATEL